MENLKAKIQALIDDRQKFIIQKYSKPGNILPSENDVINCRRELIEDPIIVALNKQLIELVTDEILTEIIVEEKEEEIRRQEIIKNGCPHTNKIERIATISRTHFLECDVCYKQFDMNGVPIS